MNVQPGMVSAHPVPDPTRPNGTPHPRAVQPSGQPSGFAAQHPERWRAIMAQLRAVVGPQPPQQPVSPPPGTTTTTTAPQQPTGPLPGIFFGSRSFTPPTGIVGGMVGAHSQPRGPIVPANAQTPSRVIGVPRGSVRTQLSSGPRPGRSTAFHDYTGSSVGSESGHYARVKGFTS